VTAGAGTYAPRNRQAYASKRLQQVVDDFRKKRKKDSPSLTPPLHSRSEPASEDEATPTNKRKRTVTRGKGTAQAGTSGNSRRGRRGRKGGRGTSQKKPRAAPSSDDSNDDESLRNDEEGRPESAPDPVVVARLRPRPKPRPAFRGAHEALSEPPINI